MTVLNSTVQEIELLLSEAEATFTTDRQRSNNLAEQSLKLCRTLNEPVYLARALDLVGRVFQSSGALSKAKELMSESLTLRQAANEQREIGISLRNLGNLARLRGDFQEAEDRIYQSIALFSELNDTQQLGFSIQQLHGALVYGGKFAESVRLFEAHAPIYHDLGLPEKPDAPTIVSAFGLMHLGRYDEAEERFQKTLSIYPQTASGYAIKNLGRIAMVRGNYDQAQTHLIEALALFRKTEEMNGLGQTLGCLGITALRVEDLVQAQNYIDENLQIAADSLMILPSMTALSSNALLQAEKGNVESAVELYAAASQTGHVANSRWYHDVIGQHIAAAAESLSLQVIESVKERGRAGSWQSALQELSVS